MRFPFSRVRLQADAHYPPSLERKQLTDLDFSFLIGADFLKSVGVTVRFLLILCYLHARTDAQTSCA